MAKLLSVNVSGPKRGEPVTQPRPVIEQATSDRTQVDDYRDLLQADLKIAARVHRSMIPANERRGNLEIVCVTSNR